MLSGFKVSGLLCCRDLKFLDYYAVGIYTVCIILLSGFAFTVSGYRDYGVLRYRYDP
jgi:hypothetical protein